jgi:hypothetical protein
MDCKPNKLFSNPIICFSLFKAIPYVDYIIPYNEILTNANEEIIDY